MSDYDKEQKTVEVPQHKRMAMGVPLTGQSMEPGKTEAKTTTQPKGGLSQAKKEK